MTVCWRLYFDGDNQLNFSVKIVYFATERDHECVGPKSEYIKMSFGHVIRKGNAVVRPLMF
jgi:hypothetical protein